MQLQQGLQQARLGDHLVDQGAHQLLHPLERDHLGHQEIDHRGLDTRPVLRSPEAASMPNAAPAGPFG